MQCSSTPLHIARTKSKSFKPKFCNLSPTCLNLICCLLLFSTEHLLRAICKLCTMACTSTLHMHRSANHKIRTMTNTHTRTRTHNCIFRSFIRSVACLCRLFVAVHPVSRSSWLFVCLWRRVMNDVWQLELFPHLKLKVFVIASAPALETWNLLPTTSILCE